MPKRVASCGRGLRPMHRLGTLEGHLPHVAGCPARALGCHLLPLGAFTHRARESAEGGRHRLRTGGPDAHTDSGHHREDKPSLAPGLAGVFRWPRRHSDRTQCLSPCLRRGSGLQADVLHEHLGASRRRPLFSHVARHLPLAEHLGETWKTAAGSILEDLCLDRQMLVTQGGQGLPPQRLRIGHGGLFCNIGMLILVALPLLYPPEWQVLAVDRARRALRQCGAA
mmetsp:Transcript_3532/g.10294  ORF Transcript_3532/g.10294 Transcript_3532/m.10294 type:complete len:225 (+) Transcript_3532:1214-1888(+)